MKTPELIARLLKDGGRLLLVGGNVEALPDAYKNHPQLILWDDDRQSNEHKEVPSNVRIIMWNRWVSHSMVARLNEAARQLRAIKFPMLRTREIKELLAEVIQADPLETPAEEVAKIVEEEVQTEEREELASVPPVNPEPVQGVDMARKKSTRKPAPLQEFIAKHLDINKDYSVKGSIKKEADRLFAIAEKERFKTTIGSMTNAVALVIRAMGKKSPGAAAPRKTSVSTRPATSSKVPDDFEELENLIQDAIIAMKLVQEHLPKVRKETERLRGLHAKVRALFGDA